MRKGEVERWSDELYDREMERERMIEERSEEWRVRGITCVRNGEVKG